MSIARGLPATEYLARIHDLLEELVAILKDKLPGDLGSEP